MAGDNVALGAADFAAREVVDDGLAGDPLAGFPVALVAEFTAFWALHCVDALT